MIKIKILLAICILAIAGLSCALPNQAATVAVLPSQAQAAIDRPKDGEVLPLAPYEIAYHGSDLTEVSQVELAINSVPVTIQSNPTPGTGFVLLRYVWTPPAAGTYVIQTRAQNQKGEWGPYSYITITVEAAAVSPTTEPVLEETIAPSPTTTSTVISTVMIPTVKINPGGVFTSITKSADKFYYGAESCGPTSINFTVSVNNPKGIRYVYIFVRLDDKASTGLTDWSDGKHVSATSSGNYTVTIKSMGDVPNYGTYPEAWLGYQFIIQQPDGELVRSEVYYDITLAKCP